MALQVQRDVYQTYLQRCHDEIDGPVINCHVSRANDPGRDNIIMIAEKITTPKEDYFYEYPCYILYCKNTKTVYCQRLWFRAQYSHHSFVVEGLNHANSTHAVNHFFSILQIYKDSQFSNTKIEKF